jgi:hypothetical protein
MRMYEVQRKELIAMKVILRKIDGYDFRHPDKYNALNVSNVTENSTDRSDSPQVGVMVPKDD